MTLPLETLHQRIAESELGREWFDDPLMSQDILFKLQMHPNKHRGSRMLLFLLLIS